MKNSHYIAQTVQIQVEESIKAIYVSIGAYGFHALERDYEKATCAKAADEFKNFTER